MKYALLIDDHSLPFLSILVKSEGECGVPNLEIYPFRVLILYVLFIFTAQAEVHVLFITSCV